MRSIFFPVTQTHREAFGRMTPRDLRRIDGTDQERQWGNELADQLDVAHLSSLETAPAGWGWRIEIPDTAAPPTDMWRIKIGTFETRILRHARDAFQLDYTDRFAARIADLAAALERDGFTRLDDAPENWNWIPGGR